MEIVKEIRDFLMTRRAKITPDQVDLPTGGRRRVPGLRREEVALLAGVSAEYYVQIERGQVTGVSDEILRAVAAALRLDDEETAHLFALTRAAAGRAESAVAPGRGQKIPEGVQALMDSMVTAPAVVQNGHLDVLGANVLGRVLYAEVLARASGTPNVARFVFLDDRADQTFPAWKKAADDCVALLRTEAARAPESKPLTALVGELATRSQEFRTRWAAHDVRAHRRGSKQFRHPAVGDLTLRFEALEISSAAGLTLVGYTAEPGSPSQQALQLLSSWAATEQTPTAAIPRDKPVRPRPE